MCQSACDDECDARIQSSMSYKCLQIHTLNVEFERQGELSSNLWVAFHCFLITMWRTSCQDCVQLGGWSVEENMSTELDSDGIDFYDGSSSIACVLVCW